jgi:hypothetical protein
MNLRVDAYRTAGEEVGRDGLWERVGGSVEERKKDLRPLSGVR